MAKKKVKNWGKRVEKLIRMKDVFTADGGDRWLPLSKKQVKWGRWVQPASQNGQFSIFGKGADGDLSLYHIGSVELKLLFETEAGETTIVTFVQVFPLDRLERLPIEFGLVLNPDLINRFLASVLNREGGLEISSTDKDEDNNRLVDLVFTWRTFVATARVRLDDYPEVFRFDRPED